MHTLSELCAAQSDDEGMYVNDDMVALICREEPHGDSVEAFEDIMQTGVSGERRMLYFVAIVFNHPTRRRFGIPRTGRTIDVRVCTFWLPFQP